MEGKDGRCVGLTTLPLSCAEYHEIWEPERTGTHRAWTGPVQGLLYNMYLRRRG